MEARTYRSRRRPTPKGDPCEITERDVKGLFDPVSRYGRVVSSRIRAFDKRKWATRPTILIHELAQKPLGEQLLLKSEEFMSYGGQNGQDQYMLGRGAQKYLDRLGYFPVPKIGPSEKSDHDLLLGICVQDMELAIGDDFISHRQIIKNAPKAIQESKTPFKFPIGRISHNGRTSNVEDLEPDAIFGLRSTLQFFFVEFDMGTETIAPERDLTKKSILRNTLCYERLDAKRIGLPNFRVLYIFRSEERMHNAMKKAVKDVVGSSERYLFNVYDPLADFKRIKPPSDYLVQSEWLRVGHAPIKLGA